MEHTPSQRDPETPASQDVLSGLVRDAQLQGMTPSTASLGAPWRLKSVQPHRATLYTVVRGAAQLEVQGIDSPIAVSVGDVALFPKGGAHCLRSGEAATERNDVAGAFAKGLRAGRALGGAGARTELVRCEFRFNSELTSSLVDLLPGHLVVAAPTVRDSVARFTEALVHETQGSRPGTNEIVQRVAELVYLCALRVHFENISTPDPGLGSALLDPHIGRALQLIDARLADPWTVASLAARVGMSRAAFSQLFTEKAFCPPMRYLQLRRIREAKRLMVETSLTLGEIGRRVGYPDATGFSRAFRREVGQSPREYRRDSKRVDATSGSDA